MMQGVGCKDVMLSPLANDGICWMPARAQQIEMARTLCFIFFPSDTLCAMRVLDFVEPHEA